MKFSVAALLGVTSAALSRSQLLYNELNTLSLRASEFEAPEKVAIFNKIAYRKIELATLKGLVHVGDARNYNGAMNLMEARKEKL
jgi:hypothetical protein